MTLNLLQRPDQDEPTLNDIAQLMADDAPGRLFVCEPCGAKRFAPAIERRGIVSAVDGWAKVHGRCVGLVGA